MNLGAGEIAFIALAALILFGPKRLPEIARTVGKALREFRRATGELTEELKAGLDEPGSTSPKPDPPRELRPGPRG